MKNKTTQKAKKADVTAALDQEIALAKKELGKERIQTPPEEDDHEDAIQPNSEHTSYEYVNSFNDKKIINLNIRGPSQERKEGGEEDNDYEDNNQPIAVILNTSPSTETQRSNVSHHSNYVYKAGNMVQAKSTSCLNKVNDRQQ